MINAIAVECPGMPCPVHATSSNAKRCRPLKLTAFCAQRTPLGVPQLAHRQVLHCFGKGKKKK